MAALGNVLIVGGGTAGSALAILLARGGVAVDVAEIKPDLTALGSGITLQGNALRVLHDLGVWDRVAAAGFAFDSLGLRTPGGDLVAEIPDAHTGGPGLPATLGMNRPELAAILADAVRDAGARIRLGLTVDALADTGDGVRAELSDGTAADYDLVVGADGIRSRVRGLLGVGAAPRPAGMGIWRIHTRRPKGVERTDLVYGGPCFIAGYCPTGEDTMYAYLVEKARPRESVTDAGKPALMRALAEGYGGAWDEIRADITDPERINYTWFESLLVDRPWNRGRTVLIGDAAHACPPTLAQGAAQCLEDAAVLAELLLAADRLDQPLFDAFMDRRYGRVKAVVEASLQLADWQLNPVPDADVPGLMGRISAMVTQRP
ncbi:FAD-dependent monooxygenase [Planomonospora venezuelensis]|uniref:2-polyprenyl-6-methoxyphenol hydroxylase-like FAD-dependent oxidoreductase n=1 Tax=Planomonospora venezuelensis TaxID=1999 RepID=A0A841D255_PLAVE|nr:FAD-dependent monooxygenase [Planomonospora venezuelensis]MBB5962468.1 2-polyprenyl-6-methoxyphenol hydroxylase-like FAD-dependent oxidoreductase [Planomonospora venezuelensis]GIN00851.1 FAD-dependent oxidoreductase [Planomonospora venezuelensis]